MNIYDRIDNILRPLNVPFYDTMPAFAENNEPQLYIVYSLYDTPDFYGDGTMLAVKYIVTINVIGFNAKTVDELQETISDTLESNDFVYGGCNYNIDTDYPKKYRRIIDFSFYNER